MQMARFSSKAQIFFQVTTPDRRPWLVDVCWGAVCYKHPLELVVGKEQTQTTGIFKVLKCDDDGFVLQRRFKSVIQPKGKKYTRETSVKSVDDVLI